MATIMGQVNIILVRSGCLRDGLKGSGCQGRGQGVASNHGQARELERGNTAKAWAWGAGVKRLQLSAQTGKRPYISRSADFEKLMSDSVKHNRKRMET